MKKVVVYSRGQVMDMSPSDKYCLISIWSKSPLNTRDYKDDDINMDGWMDVIKMEFDDVTYQQPKMKFTLFDHKFAGVLLDFIEKNDGEFAKFIVHCDAGISRSTAVAAFLKDAYDYDVYYKGHGHSDQFRNVIVYTELRREWMRRNGTSYEETAPDVSSPYARK